LELRYGHLDCLKYAHENGLLHWNADTCLNAAFNGHLDCLKYAVENGCPIPKKLSLNVKFYLQYKNTLEKDKNYEKRIKRND